MIKADRDLDIYKLDMSQIDPGVETMCLVAHASNDESNFGIDGSNIQTSET